MLTIDLSNQILNLAQIIWHRTNHLITKPGTGHTIKIPNLAQDKSFNYQTWHRTNHFITKPGTGHIIKIPNLAQDKLLNYQTWHRTSHLKPKPGTNNLAQDESF